MYNIIIIMDTCIYKMRLSRYKYLFLYNFARKIFLYNSMEKTEKKGKKGQLDIERQLAHEYFMSGMIQKEIAEKVGVSAQTINKWIKVGQWDTLRAARTISRTELVNKMLTQINERLEAGDWTADEMIKATAAIEKLDKKTNVVTLIEAFGAYNKWLVSRMQIDQDLTPELVKSMNKYQDIFISEQLSMSKVQFL